MTPPSKARGPAPSGAPLPWLPFLIYNALLLLLSPLLLAALGWAILTGRRAGKTWRGQMGLELPAAPVCSGAVWIQASSVGESLAVTRLVHRLRERYPGLPVLLTGSTPEGQRIARERTGADYFATFPYDVPGLVPRYFEVFRPSVCILVETEIWPNFIRSCAEREVPIVLVNGRISPARMQRYRALRGFYGAFLSGISLFLMQSEDDARRVIELGADPVRVRVGGDLKYDNLPGPGGAVPDRGGASAVIVAGSTHPGETETVLELFGRLLERWPDLALVVAPRHPETWALAAPVAGRLGLAADLRSAGGLIAPGRVLVIDGVGELAGFYGAATVAFVGGSLVPVGGHSLLEPASLGKPVLFGPHTFNFRDAAQLLGAARGGRRVDDASELEAALGWLLERPEEAAEMGRRARAAIQERTGATELAVEALGRFVEGNARELPAR